MTTQLRTKFIAMLVLATAVAVSIYLWDRKTDQDSNSEQTITERQDNEEVGGTHAHEGEVDYYTCPMHPSVKQHAEGQCPICGMDLTAVKKQGSGSRTIVVDESRRQKIGVRTAAAEVRPLTLEIRAFGEVKYDETRLSDVNLRMSGWVEKLLVNETGQRVKKGQTLFTLYSPELYAAQLEHLSSLRHTQGTDAEVLSDLTRASRQRLRLLGMSASRIKQLETRLEAWENVPIAAKNSGHVIEINVATGARIEAGTRVFRIADLSKVWVDAEIFESDSPYVKVGQTVQVELPYIKNRTYKAKVDFVHPVLDEKTRTVRVRIVLPNQQLEIKPAMYADALFRVPLGDRLAVPDSAVVYTGPRRIVFVDVGEGRLLPTEVKLGVHAGQYFEIVEGIAAGDVVVTSGNFLISAESRIQSAVEDWGMAGGHAQH